MRNLQQLPGNWTKCKVSDVCSKITDGTHDTPQKTPNGVPFITAVHVKDGFIDFGQCYYVDENTHNEIFRRCNPEKGDVLFVNIGAGTASAALVKVDFEFSLKNVALLKPNARLIDGAYLEAYLAFNKLRMASYLFSGGAQPFLSLAAIGRLPIELPPLPEQKKIASFLTTWDRAIELTEKLIAAKQKRIAGLMQTLLTGTARFQRFVKSTAKTPTHYGTIPADWQYLRISELATEVSERNKGGTSHQVLSCTKYDGLVDSLSYFGRQIFSDDLATYKVVRRNQFAYATNHIEEGSIGYQNICDAAVISPMYTVFKTVDLVDDGFLYKVLKSNLYIHIYQVNTSASVDRRGSLRWSEFSQIRVPVPTLEEQRAIAEVIDTQQREIDLLGSKLDALRRQKKGLMQQLLTGKVRVNVTGASGE